MKRAILLAVFMLCSTFASAQTTNIPQTSAYTVSFPHDGVFTAGYKLYLDDIVVASVPVTALQAGVVKINAPAIATLGSHKVVVSAHNATSEIKSDPITITVVQPDPKKPTNITITVVVAIQ